RRWWWPDARAGGAYPWATMLSGGRPCPARPRGARPLVGGRALGGRPVDPGREHYFPPVWVPIGDAAIVLPVSDLRDRMDAGGGQPRLPLPLPRPAGQGDT